MKPRYTFRYSVSGLRTDKIKDLLQKEQLTIAQIATEIYLSARWTKEYIKHLHAQRLIYICAYRQLDRGEPIAIYALGSEKDATKPPKKTPQKKARQDWKKLKSNLEKYDLLLARKRARSIKPKRDQFVSALFGRAA